MRRRWITRPAIVIGAALGILVGSPTVALAKTTATPGYSYISAADCAWTQAWLTDEGSRPGLWSVGTTDWFNGNTCGNNTFVAQSRRIALKQNLMIWTDFGGWGICNTNAPFVYNPAPSHDVWTGFGWASPPCGNGFYRSWSQAWSWNGAFHSHTPILGNDWVIAE